MADLENWKTIRSETVFDGSPWVTVFDETVELPDGRPVEGFYRIRMRDFVCIYPELEDGSVLTLTQYKHGPRCVSLTFPGGHLEVDEEPVACARRELLEETGYEAAEFIDLGRYVVSANQHCANAHFFKATGCRQVAEPASGDLEEMVITPIEPRILWERARKGEIILVNQLTLLALATHPEIAGS